MVFVTPSEIRENILLPGQAMLEFFSGEEHIYAFLVSAESENLVIKKIPWSQQLKDAINQINDDIRESRDIAYVQSASYLYEHLLKPFFEESLPESLIVVPDGPLGSIPYSALLTREVKADDIHKFRDHPYLNKQVCLSRWSSASSFVKIQYPDNKKESELELLAYAPSFRPIKLNPIAMRTAGERSQLFNLKYNIEEINNIANRFKKFKLLKGSQATKMDFSKNGPRAKIIHFATHGKVNKEHPQLSFIAFSNELDTTDQFYKLGLNDLYNMDLSAEMVVLSACETGLGKIVKGEGAMSMARGFTYAGAKSVVTTLWSINDKSTYQMMDLFYAHLKDGKRKDKALQLATKDYIKNARIHDRAHPKYWAAITASGNMEPIFSKPFIPIEYLIAFLILLVTAGLFYYKRKKS